MLNINLCYMLIVIDQEISLCVNWLFQEDLDVLAKCWPQKLNITSCI